MDTDSLEKQSTILGKALEALNAFSSAWPVVVSVSTLLSVCSGLFYWSEFYAKLGVSYGAYLRIEDLGTGIFQRPDLFFDIFCLIGLLFLVCIFVESYGGEYGYFSAVFIFSFTVASIFVLIPTAANFDAQQVVVGQTPYFDVSFSKLSGKDVPLLKRVVFAGGLSEFLVFYDPQSLHSSVVARASIASIEPSEELDIDESRGGLSWLMSFAPDAYDGDKLRYRGYLTCPHRDGGVLPCRDKDGELLKMSRKDN